MPNSQASPLHKRSLMKSNSVRKLAVALVVLGTVACGVDIGESPDAPSDVYGESSTGLSQARRTAGYSRPDGGEPYVHEEVERGNPDQLPLDPVPLHYWNDAPPPSPAPIY